MRRGKKGSINLKSNMSNDQIVVENAPNISDVIFRHFRGESDYISIATVITGSSKADGFEREVTSEDISIAFSKHITNCDPYKDFIFAEVSGEVVGYARGWWDEEPPSTRIYKHSGFLLPAWRRKGIGFAMLCWLEKRLKEIAAMHPGLKEKYLHTNVSQSEKGAIILLENSGYQPIRHFYQMVRPDLDNIPDNSLPGGLEIRPVTEKHYPAIWKHVNETSQDEWGYTEPTEDAYRKWLEHPHFQPKLWQIAWDKDTDEVVGTVLTCISHEENEQFGRKRGYTEGIGVSQKWRRKGVASALISLSLKAQKAAGMRESALVADTEDASNVTRLYEKCGFQVMSKDTIYRKPL